MKEKDLEPKDDYVVLQSISAKKRFGHDFPCIKNFFKLKKNYLANLSNMQFQLYSPDSKVIRKLKAQKEKEKLKETELAIQKQKSKRNKILNYGFFALNIVVIAIILVFQARKDGVAPAGSVGANWWYILIAFTMFATTMFAESLSVMSLTHKATNVLRPFVSYKTAGLGRYYDVVTPFSTGGQPFQIFYLHKYGIKTGQAVSITLAKYIFKQIASVLFFTFILLFNIKLQVVGSTTEEVVVSAASWIGYGILSVLLLITILVSNNKRIGTGLVVISLKLLKKLHIIKNYPKAFRSVMRGVGNWHNTMRAYRKSPITVICNVIIGIGGLIALYSGPYFIYCAFEGWHPEMWIRIMTLAVIVELAASFMPLPGGTGMAELSFVALFGKLFMSSNVFWALIIWRCYSYYIYVAQGLGILVYDFAFGKRRLAKYKDKWNKPKFKISI